MKTPNINKQTKEEVLQKIELLSKNFLPEWKPSEDEPGWAIAQTFTDMKDAINSEINNVPKKLFLSYLDSLGFTQAAPLSAKVPITFALKKKFNGSILIKEKTEIKTENDISFETDNNFTAQSSKLTALVYTDNINNNITDISEKISTEEKLILFEKNKTSQYLYFGDDNLFSIHSVNGDTNPYLNFSLNNIEDYYWQYWGENKTEKEPQWINFDQDKNKLNKTKTHKSIKGEVNGITSYWIRAILSPSIKEQTPNYKISFKSRSGIDALYYNTQPIQARKTVYPFGLKPQEQDTFYISSNEAFSKKGAECGIYMSGIHTTLNGDGNVLINSNSTTYNGLISFQYYNGQAWKNLIIKSSIKNEQWRNNGVNISFDIPNDLQEINVNGDKNFWIRLKLVKSSFGKYTYSNDQVKEDFHPPYFTNLDIYIDVKPRTPQFVLREAHNEFTNMLKQEVENPYTWLSKNEDNTLYLGFDKPFNDGLISMLMSVDKNTNTNYLSKYSIYTQEGWSKLIVKDDSYALMKSGICSFSLSHKQKLLEKFSHKLYWIKIDFTQLIQTEDNQKKSFEIIKMKGIYLNSVMATQTKSIEKKHIGNSDGSVFQSFNIGNAPVINVKLWIKEENIPNDAPYYQDDFNEGYWVQWKEVEHFSPLSYDKRVYCVDSHNGIIKFADIKTGKVPPISKDSIIVSYQLSGGISGNVSENCIIKPISSIAYVDKINNYESAFGGANEQSIESLKKAAPKQIRHHYQAVTRDDFNSLIYEVSSNIAKSNISTSAGIVNISIIPFHDSKQPLPTEGLRQLVYDYIKQRTSPTIKIIVQEPKYMAINLVLNIVVEDWNLISTLKSSLNQKIDEYLHPLNGGTLNQGWNFGEAPTLSNILNLLHKVDGISYISKAQIYLNNKILYNMNGQEILDVDDDIMIFSGEHTINIEARGQ